MSLTVYPLGSFLLALSGQPPSPASQRPWIMMPTQQRSAIVNNGCKLRSASLQWHWSIVFLNGQFPIGFSHLEKHMSFGWKTSVLAGIGALTLGTAAQAADLDLPNGESWYGQEQSTEYESVYEAPIQPRHHWQERHFYGRPVAEARPWERPAFARPAWSRADGCRVIVKERINPWGERVIRRIRICD
jgi:hypothetical protein